MLDLKPSHELVKLLAKFVNRLKLEEECNVKF